MPDVTVSYIGGPTAIVEYAGARLLTDPTFDPAGSDYPTNVYTLHKTQAPAIDVSELGRIDAVLLSHDHHFDNLDRAGRALLAQVPVTLTTHAGADRLKGTARGLAAWESFDLTEDVRVTATPARHGPAGGDRGPAVGFVLAARDGQRAIYFSGDTVWFDGVEAIGRRFSIDVALLNMGNAQVAVAGPHALTFTADDGVTLARAWPRTRIVPLHYEGWEHFTEGRSTIASTFEAAGFGDRITWLQPGVPARLEGGT